MMKKVFIQLTAAFCLLMTTTALTALAVEKSPATSLTSLSSTGAQTLNASASEDLYANYNAALSVIRDGQTYRVYTLYNGEYYYLTEDGYLTPFESKGQVFYFHKVRGEEYEYGFMIQNGFTCFTNPEEENDDALNRSHLNTTSTDARHIWEAQVLFLNDGKFAIRCTNAKSGTQGWNRLGSAFWTVNPSSEGPLAEYSYDIDYVWQLVEAPCPTPMPDLEMLVNGGCNGTSDGWTASQGMGYDWLIESDDEHTYWKSSYNLCTLSQTITLEDFNIDEEYVDNGFLWCAASAEMRSSTRSDNNGLGAFDCRVSVKMLDANGTVLSTVTLMDDNTYFPYWDKYRTTPFQLVSGTRSITYLVEGRDPCFWAGNFGPCFTNLSLRYITVTTPLEGEPYPVWVGSKHVTSENKDDILGDGSVSYTPGEGSGTLTFNTSTPTIIGSHSWQGTIGTDVYNYKAKVFAEGIDLTIDAPNGLTIDAGTDEKTYGIITANEGNLTINGNFNLSAGGGAVFLEKGDLTVNGNFTSTSIMKGFLILSGDVNISGDVYVKTTSTKSTTLALNNGYLYIGPGRWEIESGLDVVYAMVTTEEGNPGSIVIPSTNEIAYPVGGSLSADHRGILNPDNSFAKHVIIQKKGANPEKIIDLSTLTADCVVPDGYTITDTLNGFYKVSIADGATVSLRNVTISMQPESSDSVTISTWDTYYRWAGLTCEGDATILIEDGVNTVKGFCNEYPGIYVPAGKTLIIDGTGELNAISGGSTVCDYAFSSTGIGGAHDISCGNIIINGGTVTATSGAYAAAIGSAMAYENEVTCGDITINGGTVTATGGRYCAGIGSGMGYGASNTCGDITINGGIVTAISGDYGAGIGATSGYYSPSSCGNITITGGTVTATCDLYGAGIGGAIGFESYNTCGDITISGGTVTATGGKWAAGIGGSCGYNGQSSCDYITISGGDVTATGGEWAAGIGSGLGYYSESTCVGINISGGTVTATGGVYGAAIGSGTGYSATSVCYSIDINGGTVTATGGSYGAGIGSGWARYNDAFCGYITINGGDVTATGGEYAAAIGSGVTTEDENNPISSCGDITITEGITKVDCTAYFMEDGWQYQIIGAGWDGNCGTVTIDDNLSQEYIKDETFARCIIQHANANKGDVNGDNEVNVSDVTMLVSMILGNTTQNSAADVNGDGEVNVSDVTALVSIILGQTRSK